MVLKEGGLRMGAIGRARYVSTSFDRYWMSLMQLLAVGRSIGTIRDQPSRYRMRQENLPLETALAPATKLQVA